MFKKATTPATASADENGEGEDLNYRYCDLSILPPAPQSTKHLVSLILSHNRFEIVPPEICNHKTLKHLYLSSNQIKTLPARISELTKLETLCLEANLLTSHAIEDAKLDKLVNLSKLLLVGNQLTTFPESICGITKLTRLGLSHNQLTEIPDKITKLTNLQWLGLAYNRLKTLNPLIAKIPTLRGVTLAGNDFEREWSEASKMRNLVSVMHVSPDHIPEEAGVTKPEHNLVVTTTATGPTELEMKKLFAIPGPFSAGHESRYSMTSISTSMSSISNESHTLHEESALIMPTVPEGETLPGSGLSINAETASAFNLGGNKPIVPSPLATESLNAQSDDVQQQQQPGIPTISADDDGLEKEGTGSDDESKGPANPNIQRLRGNSGASLSATNQREGSIASMGVEEVFRCGTCSKEIDAEYVSACDKTYHPECFTCATCTEMLNEFFEYEGKAYCPTHIHAAKGLLCFSCNKPLTTDYLLASGKGFHTECFVCSKCKTSLETRPWMGDDHGILTCFDCLGSMNLP
ncbi:hypothetical protein SmJEL517_g03269 [Synchytrium microbalum]|uniref:LIM zinc-binding domain-containing protein n=1 Tax=Synchytrium microbalum TaxID=1806994 RepID=A0A507C2Q6_9FUNG|nr:uncharacterized protein SmJEL517_g03269 [Synchytrium microbalum]TPX34012.1 hypothetical protein SmJEL517_g03269 [Synchytrium microbalum]